MRTETHFNNVPIWPNVNHFQKYVPETEGDTIENAILNGKIRSTLVMFETAVRIKHPDDGKYYLITVITRHEVPGIITQNSETTSEFTRKVALCLAFCKLDPNIKTAGAFEPPRPVFELDPDQTPENERLEKYAGIKKDE